MIDQDFGKVSISNILNESKNNMSLACMKLFEFALSQIPVQQKGKKVILKINDIFQIIGKNSHERNNLLKKVINELLDKAEFYIIDSNNKEKSLKPVEKINLLEEYGELEILFSNEILPYITSFKENFTRYGLVNIINLNSRYSIILYKILIEKFNIYCNYQSEDEETLQFLERYKNPKISVKELRMLTDTFNKYQRFSSFKKSVLDKAVNEISEKTNILVKYKVKYTGRRVTDIQFFVLKNKKVIKKNKLLSFKKLETAEQKTNEKNQKIINVFKSNYLRYLINFNLLKPDDFIGLKMLRGLANKVFPLYSKIEDKFGLPQLKRHMEYVSEHKSNGWANGDNISQYLYISAKKYYDKMTKKVK